MYLNYQVIIKQCNYVYNAAVLSKDVDIMADSIEE